MLFLLLETYAILNNSVLHILQINRFVGAFLASSGSLFHPMGATTESALLDGTAHLTLGGYHLQKALLREVQLSHWDISRRS